jgi:hypothetical protein
MTFLILLVMRKMSVKSHNEIALHTRTDEVIKTNTTKCWQRYGVTEIVTHYWWECKMGW